VEENKELKKSATPDKVERTSSTPEAFTKTLSAPKFDVVTMILTHHLTLSPPHHLWPMPYLVQ